MKKIILLASVLLSFTGYSLAKGVELGVNVGVSGSISKSIHSIAYQNLSNQLGIGGYFGGVAELNFGIHHQRLRLQIELLAHYNTLRNELGTMTLMIENSKTNVHSMMLPVLAKYYLTPDWTVYAGPSFSYNFLARNGLQNLSNQEWNYRDKTEMKEVLRSFQTGFIIGTSYQVYRKMYMEIRYQSIFGGPIKYNALLIPEYGNIHNFSLGVGYKF